MSSPAKNFDRIMRAVAGLHASPPVILDYDEQTDVLYARYADRYFCVGDHPIEGDLDVVRHRDRSGNFAGITLIYASDYKGLWDEHDIFRKTFPLDMHKAISTWLRGAF